MDVSLRFYIFYCGMLVALALCHLFVIIIINNNNNNNNNNYKADFPVFHQGLNCTGSELNKTLSVATSLANITNTGTNENEYTDIFTMYKAQATGR